MEHNKLTPEGAMTIGAFMAVIIILSIIIAS
jgi:preprotein translocase subunit Sec61beta